MRPSPIICCPPSSTCRPCAWTSSSSETHTRLTDSEASASRRLFLPGPRFWPPSARPAAGPSRGCRCGPTTSCFSDHHRRSDPYFALERQFWCQTCHIGEINGTFGARRVESGFKSARGHSTVSTLLLRAGLVFTGTGDEFENGWVLVRDGMIAEVGSGAPPKADAIINEPNCVAMPGLVNAHDHRYQWATRGYAPDGTLFEWLRTLYPVWARIDADSVRAAARAAMARLLLSGCPLSTDHHYVFPSGRAGLFEALVETASALGLRVHRRPASLA